MLPLSQSTDQLGNVAILTAFSVLNGNRMKRLGLRWLWTRFFISNSFCVTDEGRDVMCGALDLIFNCDESRTDNGGSARLKADTVRD